jgi:hypothetical protein
MVMRAETGEIRFGSGRYVDRFERRAGEWRIAARVVVVEALSELGPADMSVVDQAFAPSRQDRSDPSYERPLLVRRTAPGQSHVATSG